MNGNPGITETQPGDGIEVELDGFRFSIVPEDVTFDTDLSMRGKAVYAALLRYGGSSGQRFPSYNGLAERMGVSRDTIKRAVGDLQRCGWLTVVVRRPMTNLFTLHQVKQSRFERSYPNGADMHRSTGQECTVQQGTDAPLPIAIDREQPTEKQVPAKKATKRSGTSTRARPNRAENDPADRTEGSDEDGWDDDWLADTTPIRAETPTAPLADTGPSGAPLITLDQFLALDR